MKKPAAVALSLTLLAQSLDALAAPAAPGLRFQKAVYQPQSVADFGDGITLSPAVAGLLERAAAAGRFQKTAGGAQHEANPLVSIQAGIRALARKVSPTVVTIKITKKAPKPQEQDMIDKLLEELQKGNPAPKASPQGPPGKRTPQPRQGEVTASGSGVIVSNSDGKPLIVTNAHVVALAGVGGAAEVFLAGDKPNQGRAAVVLGYNVRMDLALVKLSNPCPSCQAAALGVGDAVEDGDIVLAVGTPFGLPQTKTLGIVSYVGRNVGGNTLVEDFVQTDAAINSGNSGGGLFNVHGRLIAINTEIFTVNDGNMGLAFSIPVRHVAALIERYGKLGTVQASRIGVVVQQTNAGVVVGEVAKDSPQEKAGLAAGDLIVFIAGRPAPKTVRDFVAIVSALAPGTDVELVVRRGGRDKTVRLKAQPVTEMD